MSKVFRVAVGLVFAFALSAGAPWVGGAGRGQAFAEPYRLGFSGQEVPGKGVRVVSVTAGSPATRLYKVGGTSKPFTLVPGDLITAVDGTPVRSLAEYFRAMESATPGTVVITLTDAAGQSANWTTDPSGVETPHPDSRPQHDSAGELARLYLVIVADTHAARIGQTVKADLENVDAIFRAYIPARQLRVTTLSANQVSSTNILQEIKRQGSSGLIAGRDTLVVYYSGHGDYNLRAGDHVLTTSGGDLFLRKDVEAAARQLRPKVTVLISDACSVLVSGFPAAAGLPGPPEKVAPLFASLFFDLRPGVVPISASMKGQAAGCDANGGFFTSALCAFCLSNNQRRLDWSTVLADINRQVKQLHPDAHQTAYIVGAGNPDPPPRFGVTAQATPRSQKVGGVEVTWVISGYPGTTLNRPGDHLDYTLVAGRHIITHINGSRVRSYAEFVNAVRNSPRRMLVTVFDPVKETTREYETNLRD